VTTVRDVVAGSPATRAERPSWWRSFSEANHRVCTRFFQPRLFTVSHFSAVDWWMNNRVSGFRGTGALLEFGSSSAFPMAKLLRRHVATCSATDIDDVPASMWPAGVDFRRCTTTTLPFADGAFDLIVIRSVLEHIEDPEAVFAEMARVVKPGGLILMNLPNKWDYVSVFARLLGPLKSNVLKAVVPAAWDDYPVFYRCNTRKALNRALRDLPLSVESFRPLPSEPACLKFFVPFFLLGCVYQFLIGIIGLDALQPAFLVSLRRS
jgi:SAM-dependent methyltransferase